MLWLLLTSERVAKKVQGNQLIGASGTPLVLHGVDRSGFEFACAQGMQPLFVAKTRLQRHPAAARQAHADPPPHTHVIVKQAMGSATALWTLRVLQVSKPRCEVL